MNKISSSVENILEKKSPIPLYFQIEKILETQILEHALSPGDQLPTEVALCEHYQVSRSVIRQALQNLVNRRLIERLPGKGTFVSKRIVKESLIRELLGFYEDTIDQGHRPGTRVLEKRIQEPSPEIAANLEIDTCKSILFLKRLRFVDNEPHLLSETYLRIDVEPRLADEDFADGSLYELLENRFGLIITHGTRIVEAALATQDDAHNLDIKAGSPLLLLTSLVYLSDGRPFEYSIGKHRADRARFEVDLVRTRKISDPNQNRDDKILYSAQQPQEEQDV